MEAAFALIPEELKHFLLLLRKDKFIYLKDWQSSRERRYIHTCTEREPQRKREREKKCLAPAGSPLRARTD